jgi:predicted ester cyclase
MPTQAQMNAIDRYTTDVWSKGDRDAIDDIFTADRVRHGPDFEGTSEGAAGHKDLVALYRTSLPDLVITIEAQVGEGDTVVTRWRAQGTNLGPTLGIPPTGSPFDAQNFRPSRVSWPQAEHAVLTAGERLLAARCCPGQAAGRLPALDRGDSRPRRRHRAPGG